MMVLTTILAVAFGICIAVNFYAVREDDEVVVMMRRLRIGRNLCDAYALMLMTIGLMQFLQWRLEMNFCVGKVWLMVGVSCGGYVLISETRKLRLKIYAGAIAVWRALTEGDEVPMLCEQILTKAANDDEKAEENVTKEDAVEDETDGFSQCVQIFLGMLLAAVFLLVLSERGY